MKREIKLCSIIFLLASCSSHNFKHSVEEESFDALKDESFTRYNSSRLDDYEKISPNYILNALSNCHNNEVELGLKSLEEKMHKEKNNPYYWSAIGTCYYLKNDNSKAMFFYDLALESIKAINPTKAPAAQAIIENNIGLIHLKFKRYNEAYDSFKKAQDFSPKSLTPKINMAQLYLEFNQNDRAIKILDSINDQAKNDIDYLYSLSLAYYKISNYEKSFSIIEKINNSYINRADIVGLYALNLIKKNRFKEAKDILEKRKIANQYENRNQIILDNVVALIKESEKSKTN